MSQIHFDKLCLIPLYACHFLGYIKIIQNRLSIDLFLSDYSSFPDAHFRHAWAVQNHKHDKKTQDLCNLFHVLPVFPFFYLTLTLASPTARYIVSG